MRYTLFAVLIFVRLFIDCDQVAGAAESQAEPPNIVLILADDVGREVLGCYGGESYQTPALDQLAAEGMRFTHVYVMPVCHPTRICLLTGQYPIRIGRPAWGSFPVALEKDALPQLLKGAGYSTAVAGKWQLGLLKDDPSQPHRIGFDDYCLFGWHEGPRYHAPHIWRNGELLDDVRERYGPDVYREFLVAFMEAHREKPFFCFYSMALCHDVSDDLDAPAPYGPKGRYENFAEMVAEMDKQVGQFISAIDGLGLARRTLILFLADNGTAHHTIVSHRNGEFVREANVSRFRGEDIPGGKSQLTDAGTRVPCIARWTGAIPAGTLNDSLIDISDLLPTFAELGGVRLPVTLQRDGQSFASVLRTNGEGPRTFVFAEHKGNWFVKDRRFKLYRNGRLFDCDADQFESSPLDTTNLRSASAKAFQQLHDARQAISSIERGAP